MFNIDFNRVVTAAVGALVLSTTCVLAAVGPARAIETGPGVQVASASAISTGASA